MTKEIALHCMKSASELERELCEECLIYGQTGCDHCFEDALQYVIGMLEQEPILDKISSEIVAIDINGQVDEHTAFIRTGEQVKQMALDVIDKYREER